MAARRSAKVKLPAVVPPAAQRLFQNPALAPGEDDRIYRSLVEAVVRALEPQDVIECMLVKDVTDCQWELQRLRGIQAGLLASSAMKAAEKERAKLEFGQRSAAGYSEALEKLGLGKPAEENRWSRYFDAVSPPPPSEEELARSIISSYKDNSLELERLSRMAALAESRRTRAIRELDRYRDSIQKRSPARFEEIIDGEFTEPSAG